MYNKPLGKIILDIVMTVLFIILINPANTGMALHEIFGLCLGALFMFHIMLNWSWVKSVTKNLFNPKLKTRIRLFYILNAVSFICVLTIIFTGIGISQVLFVPESAGVKNSYVAAHKWVSYVCGGLFGVHAALHRGFILDASRILFASLKAPGLKSGLKAGAVVLVIGLVCFQFASSAAYNSDQPWTGIELPGSGGKAYASKPKEEFPTGTGQGNSSIEGAGDRITLTDYLENMFCNGCSKRCPLLNVQCSKGFKQLEAAKIQYQQQYGTQA